MPIVGALELATNSPYSLLLRLLRPLRPLQILRTG